MGPCEICGNSDGKAFSVSVAGVLGHGVEADWTMYCCA
jgi:hypothetical protein